jgi:hypothetical protein
MITLGRWFRDFLTHEYGIFVMRVIKVEEPQGTLALELLKDSTSLF